MLREVDRWDMWSLRSVAVVLLTTPFLLRHGAQAESGFGNCVRLCFATCADAQTSVIPRCVDTFYTVGGCPVDEPVEFYAQKNQGSCPSLVSTISWGKTTAANAWPNDNALRGCPGRRSPVDVWAHAGKFESIDDCKTYVQGMEGADLFSHSTQRRSMRAYPPLGAPPTALLRRALAARPDWGAQALERTQEQGQMAPSFEPFIRNLALMASVAYEDPSAIRGWTCESCQELPRGMAVGVYNDDSPLIHSSWNVQVVAAHDPATDTTIVSFRGTVETSIWNWAMDLSAAPTPYAGAQVHSGFLIGFNLLRPGVLDFLARHHRPSSALLVTGHSLGGALAVLAAYDLQRSSGHAVSSVVTFGAPRVGLSSFVSKYDVSVHRVVYHRDPVPHLPPTSYEKYHHLPTELYYASTSAGHGRQCDGSGEDPTCSNQFSFWSHLLGAFDHKMATGYLAAIPDLSGGGSSGGSGAGGSSGRCDDSCPFANDDECDEPQWCAVGTDCTDCRNSHGGSGGSGSSGAVSVCRDNEDIPGSGSWWSCRHSNTHTSDDGDHCQCDTCWQPDSDGDCSQACGDCWVLSDH